MKTITITVSVDGNEVSREYSGVNTETIPEVWGDRVSDMLDTLKRSNEPMYPRDKDGLKQVDDHTFIK